MSGVSHAFHRLGDLLEVLENAQSSVDVAAVTPKQKQISHRDDYSVDVRVTVPLLGSETLDDGTELSGESVRVTDGGALAVDLCATVSGERSSEESDAPKPSGTPKADEAGLSTAETAAIHGNADGSSEDTADGNAHTPYRKPARLREVYREHDTFAEMTDALGVDVTPQTVRRHMIKHGIHEPSSSTGSSTVAALIDTDPDEISLEPRETVESTRRVDDSSEADDGNPSAEERSTGDEPGLVRATEDERAESAASETSSERRERSDDVNRRDERKRASEIDAHAVADGVDLPQHVTLEEVKESVCEARTLYDVQRSLDVERNEVRRLLRELNLLDLVQHRLSNCDDGRTLDEIDRRIQSTAVSE